jgi:hypothetical protein
MALAQIDGPNSNAPATINHVNRAVGDVLFTVPLGFTGTLPVGLDSQIGGGGFLGTELNNAQVGTLTLGGMVTGTFPGIGNPIGVTTNGTTIWITDSTGDQVHAFNNAGTFQSSFSVAGQTTFPEGIAYKPSSNTLFVVNGSGGNAVHEYTLAGALLNSFPVAGSSQDGIAWDGTSFWLYDSGTDTVTQYDESFAQVSSFAGTGAAGFGNGEGLAVVAGTIYVVVPGAQLAVAFEGIPQVQIPTLGQAGLIAFITVLMLGSLFFMRRRRLQATA